jgi:hypothetical protein
MRPLGESERTVLNDAETPVSNGDLGASKSLAADIDSIAFCI